MRYAASWEFAIRRINNLTFCFICAIPLAQQFHPDGTLVSSGWHNCANAMAQGVYSQL